MPNSSSMQKVMLSIADNLSFGEVSHIFNEDNNEEVLTKINDVLLNLSDQVFKPKDSQLIRQQIEEIKRKYYENPSELSDTLHYYLLQMLASLIDEEFLRNVEGIFKCAYETEKLFTATLEEKDKFVMEHNALLKKLLERSSSDEEQDFRMLIEEENMIESKIAGSERKTKQKQQQENRSEHGSK